MKSLLKMYAKFKAYCITYPAVISGFIIYSYLFYCIIQYFIRAKSFTVHLSNIIESFDAFPFMWFLSVTLVKIIDIRTKLHESETQRIQAEREALAQQEQLKTLHEVTRSLQHHINNPLAIIRLSLEPTRKAADNNQKIIHQLDVIDEAVNRISCAMEDFAKAGDYAVESAGPVVGDIVKLKTGD